MIFKKILALLVIYGSLELVSANNCNGNYNTSLKYPCTEIFDIFHSCASNFLEVSMEHSNPFTVCTNETSFSRYSNMKTFFNLLTTTVDQKNFNISCSDEFLNKNQQSVILTILDTATSIWDSAYCDDCYNGSTPNASQKLSQKFSNHTLDIMKMHENYSTCTRMFKNATDICNNCEHIYLDLNTKFDREKKHRAGKICFDLEDIINKTRQEWSGTFKCCKDKKDSLTAFFSLFSTVIVIAVVFYLSIYIAGSQQPEIDLLDAQQVSPNLPTNPTLQPSTAPSSSAASSSSSQRPARVRKPRQKPKTTLLINEDSDDDEPIIRPKPVSSNLVEFTE